MRRILRSSSSPSTGADESLGLGALSAHASLRRRSDPCGGLDDGAPTRAAGAPRARVAHTYAGPPGVLLEVEPVSEDVRIFRVGRPAGFQFVAGQAVKLGLPGSGQARTYSIASAPHESHLEFCIERVMGGRLTPRLFMLSSGARLELGPRPKGKMRTDAAAAVHLMIATGTGIAPLRSILRETLRQPGNASFIVAHGSSHADALPYREELQALAATNPRVRYVPTISRPNERRNAAWSGEVGRVEGVARTLAMGLDPRHTRVYACGHPGMVGNVSAELQGRGFRVTTESFG